MENLIFPEIFGSKTKSFFTGKTPGDDLNRISQISSISRDNIYLPIQKHTDKIIVLNSLEPKIGDAVITNKRGVLIGIQVADCVPILLFDRKKYAVGAVHAGWRGTAKGILKNTINKLIDRFHSSPSDILIAIGPSIRWCCYGVGYEVIESVQKTTGDGNYIINKGDKHCLDLATANRYQALSAGILSENIWMSGECTFCLPEKYYSFRYAKGPTGRQCGFIGII